jgi:CheY-like chemotaxis protein
LQQIVWNLLSNAIHYTPAGGHIDVRCYRSETHIELSISDTGRGINQRALAHLFERHWQTRCVEPRGQGLGLGLAIVHKIVELHSGTIEAASAGEGQGAVFTVRLPCLDVTPESAASPDARAEIEAQKSVSTRVLDAVTAAEERAASFAMSNLNSLETLGEVPRPRSIDSAADAALRILLVEDHDGIAKACQRLLVSHGHFVVRAAGIAGATTAAQQNPFDLLICDLSLADGEGVKLLPAVHSVFRHRAPAQSLPAIAMSGSIYEEDISRCLAAGFSAHLAKPFDEQTLLGTIARVMQPRYGG